MTSFNLSGLSTTARTLSDLEYAFLTEFGALSVSGAVAISTTVAGTSNDAMIVNAGSIFSSTSEAIDLSGDYIHITNSGNISAYNNVISILAVNPSTDQTYAQIHNSGRIVGVGSAADGILLDGGGNYIHNTGEIIGGHNDSAIQINDNSDVGNAVFLRSEIYNLGLISSPNSSTAIDLNAAGDLINNQGTIEGNVQMENGNDDFINSGTVTGNITLGGDTDTFDGRGGRVNGYVDGGTGDDSFIVDDSELQVIGGSGTDSLISYASVLNATGFESITLRGTGNFSAIGDASTIEMTGNSGNNDLTGSTLANAMMGGGGHDVIEGLAGNDTLRGNGGDDVLNGGNNDDFIFGGTGDDTIFAGNGRDVLRGEQGADTFVYEGVSEFGNPLTRDIILGFERGKDSIDISAIDDASFDFIGTGAFTGTALELRYTVLGAGHSIVEIDADADGIKDGELLLRGITALDAGDFVL